MTGWRRNQYKSRQDWVKIRRGSGEDLESIDSIDWTGSRDMLTMENDD